MQLQVGLARARKRRTPARPRVSAWLRTTAWRTPAQAKMHIDSPLSACPDVSKERLCRQGSVNAHPLAQHPTISSACSSRRSSRVRSRGCALRSSACGRASARATASATRSIKSWNSLTVPADAGEGSLRADAPNIFTIRPVCRCPPVHQHHLVNSWHADLQGAAARACEQARCRRAPPSQSSPQSQT